MILSNEEAMLAFGRELASGLNQGDWLSINGPLGSGKTVLCKGILGGLGFTGDVTSPSYAIVHLYDPPSIRVSVAHVDLYRISSVAELEELGLNDADSNCIYLVEWASLTGVGYGNPSHLINISVNDNGSRTIDMKILRDE